MEVFKKYMSGDYSLAATFWGGYFGINILIALALLAAGVVFPVIVLVQILWSALSFWAVLKSSGQYGHRGFWGWIAVIYVFAATGNAIVAISGYYLT